MIINYSENVSPTYRIIERDLRKRITRKEWVYKESLPSESCLAKEYEVSRVTIRKALQLLELDDIIIKKQGLGSFVTDKSPTPRIKNFDYKSTHKPKLEDLPEMIAKISVRNDNEKLLVFFINLNREYEDLEYHYIERIIYQKGIPVALTKSWINKQIAPGLEDKQLPSNSITESLYNIYNINVSHVDDYISAVTPTISESIKLNISTEAALLSINGISYTKDNKIVELTSTIWIGNSIGFKLRLDNKDIESSE